MTRKNVRIIRNFEFELTLFGWGKGGGKIWESFTSYAVIWAMQCPIYKPSRIKRDQIVSLSVVHMDFYDLNTLVINVPCV